MSLYSENLNTTVDDNEVKHFNKLSWRWWNRVTALQTMNKLRVPLIRDGVPSKDSSKPFENKRVLEVGCGGGVLTEELAKLGGIVHGLDPTLDAILVARDHASQNQNFSNLTYFVGNVVDHAENYHEMYDVVIASEVLEHITQKETFLEACVKCLKPEGLIFITTFNKTLWSWFFSVILIQEVFNVIPRGTHSWDKFVSPGDVTRMLDKFNCKTLEVKGMHFNFVSNSWSWSSATSTNYSLKALKTI